MPQLDQDPVFNRYNPGKAPYDPANQAAVTSLMTVFVCPSDPESHSPILPNRGDSPSPAPGLSGGLTNPATSMGLWYPACMGPTQPDYCFYSADPTPGPTNLCCQGWNFGSEAGGGYPTGSSVGMFGRWPRAFSSADVKDGLSNTIMVAETLPGDFVWNGVFCPNFPVASTEIPMNTMISDEGLHGTWNPQGGVVWGQSSGYKSLHPGGCNFMLGDGSSRFFSVSMDYHLYNALRYPPAARRPFHRNAGALRFGLVLIMLARKPIEARWSYSTITANGVQDTATVARAAEIPVAENQRPRGGSRLGARQGHDCLGRAQAVA